MNFYRIWTYYWDVTDDPLSNIDQYRQPWRYDTPVKGKHRYHMEQYNNATCDQCSFKTRIHRICLDAFMKGMVVEVDLFDNAMGDVYWGLNPFNPNNQIPGEKNELDLNSPPKFWEKMYTAYRPNSISKLRDQQKYLVELITHYTAAYPNVFMVLMNESGIESNSSSCLGCDYNYAVLWYKGIVEYAKQTWEETPYRLGSFLTGVSLLGYDSEVDLYRLFNGYGSTVYYGLDDYGVADDFHVISYHTPYYWDGNDNCDVEIKELKDWHQLNFSSKACIIDTDGDSGTAGSGGKCDIYPDDLELWALQAYKNNDGHAFSADFNAKGARIPDQVHDDHKDYKLMRAICEAYDAYIDY